MGRQAGRLTPRHTEHSASDSGSVSAHRKHMTIGPEQDNAQHKRNKLEQDNVPQHKRNKLEQDNVPQHKRNKLDQDNVPQHKRNKLEQDNVPQHKRNKLKQNKMCHSNFATVPAKTLHSLSEVCFRISESLISTAKLRFGARSVKTLNGHTDVCHYISEALHGQTEVCHCISEALHGQTEVCHCISESSPWPNCGLPLYQ